MTESSGGPEQRGREDEWLVVRCQLGERPAFGDLIHRWHGPLWQYLRRVTGDDEAARDLAQDVWLRVLRGIGRLRDGSKLRPWLFGIARRAAMDRLRERYASRMVDEVELAAIAAPDPFHELDEELRTMQQELTRLPVIEREALTLYYLQELSPVEVAEVLRVPVATVKSRLFRARQLLHRELEAKRSHP
jgi:RNA polymerase sigma factor (sigma-70 family)